MTALFIGIGIVVGTFGSLAVPIGFVSAFWPGQAVQSAGAVWFGAWGIIAGAFFPVLSNTISGSAPLPVSLAYLPGNAVQAGLAAWAMKRFSAHPALRERRDWIIYLGLGVIVANLFGSLWGSSVLVAFGLVTVEAWPVVWVGWWVGNSIPGVIFGSILLKFVSPVIIDSKAFVKGWWA
jgi:integral membrane sensor domain MASE1